MTAEISAALQALLLAQAEAFTLEVSRQLPAADPLAFYRWVADRQLDDARKFANAARRARIVEQAADELEKALPLSRCGRCSAPVPVLAVVVTGPYRTCQPCADIIRN